MAEVLLLLGAGVYALNEKMKEDAKAVDPLIADDLYDYLEAPRDMVIHEGRERGIIAPAFQNVAARVPWGAHEPALNVWQADSKGPTDRSTERAYQVYANRLEHEREDVTEQVVRGRQYFPRKVGSAIWNAFTREISLHDAKDGSALTTNHAGLQWLPNNPTDFDYTDTAAMSKMLPPVPTLFTPDATFMTASGLPFRYGGNAI